MALDINEQVSNAYNAAKQALNDDLKQNLYNATKARVQAFRQINNNANANHSLYSGAPAGMQMNYDQQTYIPNIGKMAVNALTKQEENQEKWDKYMAYIKELQDQANYYNNLTSQIPSSTGAGYTTPPNTSETSDSAKKEFSGNSSGGGGR